MKNHLPQLSNDSESNFSGGSDSASSAGGLPKATKMDEQSCKNSSKHSETGSANGSGSNEDTRDAIKGKLSKVETRRINALRLFVLAVLVLSAAAISVVVFFITSKAESESFDTQYDGAATKILESFEGIHEKVSSIAAIGIALTSEGLAGRRSNSSSPLAWPFVTLPDFHHKAETARLLSGALYITVEPLVTDANRDEWEKYTVGPAKKWIAAGLQNQEQLGLSNFEHNPPPMDEVILTNLTSKPIIHVNDSDDSWVVARGPGPYFPQWQSDPVLKKDHVNKVDDGSLWQNTKDCFQKKKAVLSGFRYGKEGTIRDDNHTIAKWATLRSFALMKEVIYTGSLRVTFFLPVYDTFEDETEVVAIIKSQLRILKFMQKILPQNIKGITVVVENTCDGYFTYQVDGASAEDLGFGDFHDRAYDSYERTTVLDDTYAITDGSRNGTTIDISQCFYRFHVYPSSTFSEGIITKTPILVTFAVAMVFLLTIGLFLVYSYLVDKRQQLVLNKAAQSTAIVSAMFPKQIRDRLLEDIPDKTNRRTGTSNQLKSFLSGDNVPENIGQIADLYTQCTVLFADIVGFTAWSSTRGPEHVFMLLQTIYHGFDQIAKRRKVFKVETIGDCYLAVTGLPEPQPAHAVIMARFTWECKQKLIEMTRDLEVSLGPDCGELRMRFGMHSGPVTAGVLRGDRARFQLFGDTVNTASRMESTGCSDKIQITHSTAELLIAAGKSHWISARTDAVQAKGKGLLKTFWLDPGKGKGGTSSAGSSSENGETNSRTDSHTEHEKGMLAKTATMVKQDRLVEWMVDLLVDKIRIVKAKQTGSTRKPNQSVTGYSTAVGSICLDEVVEVIQMSKFDANAIADSAEVDVPQEIVMQLRQYVAIIARMYNANHFHNFEHACHVTMSVSKLLQRIVSPDLTSNDLNNSGNEDETAMFAHLHHFTYGLHSDPLAQFAIVFSALIHDVDHRGCSNGQLIKEDEAMGARYRYKSVAEQNSLDLSWNLLLTEQFNSLRTYVFDQQENLLRFRQLIVNTVLATDIFDKELNALRKSRWERAFSPDADNDADQADRKATIVIEHIIQASDVSHTMQHWQIYTKWNKMLFKEMYQAHQVGRMDADPTMFWYKGELAFLDNYVIPLAKKLKECNVFGVSSDEYLNYAVSNRSEWEHKGESIVEELVRELAATEGEEE